MTVSQRLKTVSSGPLNHSFTAGTSVRGFHGDDGSNGVKQAQSTQRCLQLYFFHFNFIYKCTKKLTRDDNFIFLNVPVFYEGVLFTGFHMKNWGQLSHIGYFHLHELESLSPPDGDKNTATAYWLDVLSKQEVDGWRLKCAEKVILYINIWCFSFFCFLENWGPDLAWAKNDRDGCSLLACH